MVERRCPRTWSNNWFRSTSFLMTARSRSRVQWLARICAVTNVWTAAMAVVTPAALSDAVVLAVPIAVMAAVAAVLLVFSGTTGAWLALPFALTVIAIVARAISYSSNWSPWLLGQGVGSITRRTRSAGRGSAK